MGNRFYVAAALVLACGDACAHDGQPAAHPPEAALVPAAAASRSDGFPGGNKAKLPCQAFSNPPLKPHDAAANFFALDQLEHHYRVPGEFTHRLTGDQYGFEALSFIITETHPGGGPGLHVHDTEEAHVLLQGVAQYRIGENTITVEAPYVAKVPAGVPHTFINVGTAPFSLVGVFASKHPATTRVGDNPLVSLWQSRNGAAPCDAP